MIPLPSGLNIRIDRWRHDGLPVRTWTTWRDGMDRVPPQERHDVVLVHGLGVSSRYFGPLASELADRGVVHLIDLPGFGDVPRPDRRLAVEDFAAVVERWVRHEGLVRPTVLGHSMGAQIVTELLAKSPDVAGHAVLVGPTTDASARSAVRQGARLARATLSEAARTRHTLTLDYLLSGPYWYAQVLPSMLAYRTEERIAQVPVPVLVVRGERDAVAPRAWVQRVAAAAPDGRWAEVPDAAHAAFADHAAEVAALVREHQDR
ncbi:alpha/beta fold hydrolase [Cellulomonas shaoxiangyii]|uniref:Alpha/beta fold hydrolase n=1 Tax=Cellulomonas shaoxiangyii TaxID=2566013 RepID=A0A4P7SMN2_9CELL|nr:alpha/beta fold hydrolase [Cellulomonas shaoxiangyii]QCB94114.1 alpha/beta fold hydrolase [Cellulomonas shaoxiangyii]TGY78282.1 alpha/beta fold hydrolase [Cellulomonas shaoxiangyii]